MSTNSELYKYFRDEANKQRRDKVNKAEEIIKELYGLTYNFEDGQSDSGNQLLSMATDIMHKYINMLEKSSGKTVHEMPERTHSFRIYTERKPKP